VVAMASTDIGSIVSIGSGRLNRLSAAATSSPTKDATSSVPSATSTCKRSAMGTFASAPDSFLCMAEVITIILF
jgi:hypothetical protein